jgi:hypothetical protein
MGIPLFGRKDHETTEKSQHGKHAQETRERGKRHIDFLHY